MMWGQQGRGGGRAVAGQGQWQGQWQWRAGQWQGRAEQGLRSACCLLALPIDKGLYSEQSGVTTQTGSPSRTNCCSKDVSVSLAGGSCPFSRKPR